MSNAELSLSDNVVITYSGGHIPCQLAGLQRPWRTTCFFLNQQFITRDAKAGRGSYFITTLSRTKEEKNEKEKREKKREKGKKKERKKEEK